MKKKKQKKSLWFIEIVGDPNATKSKAAKESMALLAKQMERIKKRSKSVF